MKKTERFKSSKSQPQVSNSYKKTNVSSTCMNRSKTAGKKEVKIAFCSAQAHSHLEEESVTAGVTLQDKENQNLHLEDSDQNGEMSENMSHQSDRSNCDNLLTLISKSYWVPFFSLLSYFPRAVLEKGISGSVSDMESQRNRLQLSLRKNLPTVGSGREMNSLLSSEKSIQGGNQETLKDAGLRNF